MNKEITQDLRNYRFIGEEAESLGLRLDSARATLKSAQSLWAQHHWQQVIEQLLFQWRSLPALHDGAASMSIIPRWTVDYEFYEIDHSPSAYNITDKIFDEIFRTSLDESWNRVREARLARAQY
jgi:Tfp pilus assembly protein PilV